MGFAELSIADLAAEYQIETETVFELCDRFKINYKNERVCLALKDAEAISNYFRNSGCQNQL